MDVSKLPRSRRPSRLTVKYDRSHLQRWLEMEQWIDSQLQELFQVGSEATTMTEAVVDLRLGPQIWRSGLEINREAGVLM